MAANDTVSVYRVIASPFTSDNVSTRHAAGIRLKLSRRARVTLTIETPTGVIVRTLLPRPTLMPALLTETLFVNDPIERDLLRRSDVREAIAIAIYLGIADYLAMRDYGIRYELVSGPSQLAAGESADYRLRG